MNQNYRIAVDAMGGDNAPQAVIEGCIMAIKEMPQIEVVLIGDEVKINKELSKYTFDQSKIEVIHTTEVITNHDSPVMAIRRKKDSSLVVGMNLVKEGKVSGIVSAGNTGAILAGGTFIVGRIKGVERPALAPLIPTKKGYSVLLDVGANADCKPSYLVQFANMGYIYSKQVLGKKSPRVGIVNIGAEESKGNMLTKETYKLLEEDTNINFIGNVEARDITDGEADVVVCDGFTGNIILKNMEGVGMFLFSAIKNELKTSLRFKIGALLLKPMFKSIYKRFDASEVGGTVLLGLNGLVVKAHGNSDGKAVFNAIRQAKNFIQSDVNKSIVENL
ncbi:phosphate acyltransferase PlsX [Vallitalea okinawensis]|uniref:phosphate acyltransferase PlsX n=1 Tax=Vallitalea okinawensis TaxID=2078660 RepID=UPI000CFB7CD3|nr:phosphate acyltransferase PlsX [Vallitalea okinawensis]